MGADFGVKISADTSDFVAALGDSEKAMESLQFISQETRQVLIEASTEMVVAFAAQKLGLSALYDSFESLNTAVAVVDGGFSILRDTLGKTFLEVENIKRDGLEIAIQFDAARAAAATLTDQSQALADRMQVLSKEVNFSVTSNELLKASYNVLSDGFVSVNDNAEILNITTKLSKAGFTDLGTATDAVTGVLNSYKLGVDQAAKVSDILIATQNAGRITVNQYAADIGKVASIASSAGIGLEEMSTFIAVATASGVQANEAITGFRQAIAAVLKPSSEAAETARSLGVQFDDAALKTKGLAGILRELESKGELTQSTLLRLFGSVEAVSAITPSAGEGARKYGETLDYVSNTVGLTDKAFQQWATSLDSEIKKAINQGQEIFLNFGIGVANVVKPLVQLVNTMLEFRNSLPKEFIQALGSISTIFAAILTAAAAALPVMAANFAITKLLGVASGATGAAMAGFAAFIAKANTQLVAMQLQMAGVNVGAGVMSNTIGLAGLKLIAADIAISGFNATTAAGTGILAKFGAVLKTVGLLALEFGKFVLTSVAKALVKLGLLVAAISAVGAAFNAIKDTGFGDAETAKARDLQAEIEKLTGSLSTASESTNFFDAAMQKLGKGMDRSNGLIDSIIIGMVNFDSAIQGTRDASDKFGEDTTQSFRIVTQAQRNAVSSTLAFAEAMVSVNKVFDSGIGILGKYGLTTLEASDRTRLGATGIAEYKKEAEAQLLIIKKTIEQLRAKNFADKDQEIANKIQIANLANLARSLENGVTFLEANTDATKENSAQSFQSAEEIKTAYDNANKAIEASGNARLVAIKQQQLDGVISAKDAAQMIAADEIRVLQERIRNSEPVVAKLKSQLLGATPEEKVKLDKLISEIESNSQKDRLKIIENGLAEKLRAEQESYKQIENIQKSATAAASAAEKQRQIDVQTLLNQGVITKQEAESRNLQATQNRINAEIAAEQFKIQALEALPTSNDPAKEAEKNAKIIESKTKISDLTLNLLKTEETAQQQVRDAAIRGLEEQGRVAEVEANKRISANLAVLNSLKAEQELFNARTSLEEAQANLAKTRLDNQIKIAQAIGDQGTAQQLKLQSIQQEIASQERIFAAQQKSLEITQQIKAADLERQRILDQIAIKESEIGLLKLKQKKDVTDGEIELANQIVNLNKEKLSQTEMAIQRQGEINSLNQQELQAKQAITRETAQGQRAEQLIKDVLEGKVQVTDGLLAQMGLLNAATTSTGAATREWSAELQLADGRMFQIGESAKGAANQTGQIYLELQKSTGEVVVFGGAMDGAKVNVDNLLGGVGGLNSGLGETVNLGDAVGDAFANVNSEVKNINQSLINAINSAIQLAKQKNAVSSQLNPNGFKGDPSSDPFGGPGSFGGTSRDYLEGLLGDNPLTGIVFNDAKTGQIRNPDDLAREYVTSFGDNLRALEDVTGRVGDFAYQASIVANKIAKSYRDAGISLSGGAGDRFNDLNRIGVDNFTGFAGGGMIRGKGTGTSDSIPAMLSNGEYVINADATAKNKGLLDMINNGLTMPKFARGGFASSSKSKGDKRSSFDQNSQTNIGIKLPQQSSYTIPTMIGQASPNMFQELGLNQVPEQMRAAIKSALDSLGGGKIIKNASGQISVSSQGANDFQRLSTTRLAESYSELQKGSERVTENLGNFASSLNTVSKTISSLSNGGFDPAQLARTPRINPIREIQSTRINPPRVQPRVTAGRTSSNPNSGIGSIINNTINVIDRKEPELDIRNALIVLGRTK
ncbi:MAG: hypothetical protein DDT31_00218 [Syntrophomonadaceae bacterium]|nr:hypothetical protein [Bacillota bacterium]